jgi:3-deoxy-7-phosphoheptulonate synthase
MNFVNDINVDEIKPLISPTYLIDELPITERALQNVLTSREIIKNILNGSDPRLLIIVGPCSIHNPEAALEYALKLKVLCQQLSSSLFIVMRTYFEKPRTTVGWKGFINDPDLNNSFNINKGLKLARELLININELGVPCGIEFLDTISPQYISDLISWGAVGARTTESQLHRELVSGLSMPIGFKNSTNGNIQIVVDAIKSSSNPHRFLGVNINGMASIIKTKGNLNTHMILRGSDHGPNYHQQFIDVAYNILHNNNISTNIVVDCSHGNSQKKYKNQINVICYLTDLIKSGYDKINGLMIESNLKSGNQPLSSNLKYGVSITDECIDWNTTENLLILLSVAVYNRTQIKLLP